MSTDWRDTEKVIKDALETARLLDDVHTWFTLEQVQITVNGVTYTYRSKGI